MSTLSVLLQADGLLLGEMCKEFARVDTVRGVVGTGIDATWLVIVEAEIARSGFVLHLRDLVPRLGEVFRLHLEWVHVDVPVGTVAGAQPAPDAPVLDHHLQAALAAD